MENTTKPTVSWKPFSDLTFTTQMYITANNVGDGYHDLTNKSVKQYLIDAQFDVWKISNDCKDDIEKTIEAIEAGNLSANAIVFELNKIASRLEGITT